VVLEKKSSHFNMGTIANCLKNYSRSFIFAFYG
jgi:hypothetical protein